MTSTEPIAPPVCACGKPASHRDADPDGPDWACRLPDPVAEQIGRGLAGLTKFDFDPEALAWARAHVKAVIDKYTDFEAQAAAKGDTVAAARWRTVPFVLRRELIGGEGCTITRFDHRRPAMLEAIGEKPPVVSDVTCPGANRGAPCRWLKS